jgi:hypothetical protein
MKLEKRDASSLLSLKFVGQNAENGEEEIYTDACS